MVLYEIDGLTFKFYKCIMQKCFDFDLNCNCKCKSNSIYGNLRDKEWKWVAFLMIIYCIIYFWVGTLSKINLSSAKTCAVYADKSQPSVHLWHIPCIRVEPAMTLIILIFRGSSNGGQLNSPDRYAIWKQVLPLILLIHNMPFDIFVKAVRDEKKNWERCAPGA